MTAEELLALLEKGEPPTILDVRSAREFADGHVPGALHIPFQNVGSRAAEVPAAPGERIVVYCGHGPRAWIAARALRAHGFLNVEYLKGHFAKWKSVCR